MRGLTTGTTDPATSSHKAKALNELSRYEKELKNVSMSVSIRKKMINGAEQLVGSIQRYDGPSSMPHEYTSMSKFKGAISDVIDSAAKQIG